MVTTSNYFTIHTKRGETVEAPAINTPGNLNNLTRGQQAVFEFFLPGELVVRDGETYTVESGTTEIWGDVTVKSGGHLVINGTLIIIDDTSIIDDYRNHAGAYAPVVSQTGTQYYRERVPSSATISSLVVGIEPSNPLQNNDVPGIWGIIDRAEVTQQDRFNDVIQLSVRILDEYSAFNDHTAIENTLKV